MPNNRHAATGGIHEVSADDKDYLRVTAEARLKQACDPVAAMPSILGETQLPATASECDSDGIKRHWLQTRTQKKKRAVSCCVNHISEQEEDMWGICTMAWFIKPTSIPEAMTTTEASPAVNKEWDKWMRLPAWDDNKVKPKTAVVESAKKGGKTIHVANLMDRCHLQNAELARYLPKY